MADTRSAGHRPVDLLFDARHIRQSGIGTYIRTQLPHLEEAADRHGLSLAVLAEDGTLPPLRPSTAVVAASPQAAGMYTPAEQRVWRRAFDTVNPRAVWVPHYPFPFARLLPRHRRMLTYMTVHDTIHLLPETVSGQSAARRMYARVMLSADARWARRIFTVSEATATTLTSIVRSARTMVTPIPVDDVWFTAPRSEPDSRHRPLPAVCRKHQAAQEPSASARGVHPCRRHHRPQTGDRRRRRLPAHDGRPGARTRRGQQRPGRGDRSGGLRCVARPGRRRRTCW